MSGFNAYQNKEYQAAVDSISRLLEKYPDTSLRDMAIFWLAKAYHKTGNRQEAGKHMARFLREYPESPLRGTVEQDLLALARKYEKAEPIAARPAPPKAPATAAPAADKTAAEKAAAENAAAQVLNLEVAQYANVDVQVGPAAETQEAGKRFTIPLEIVNSGNGGDSFQLESSFPPEFGFYFAAAAAPGTPILSTPTLAMGERFRAVATGTMPRGSIDRQRSSYPIRIVSSFAKEVSLTREIALIASAPLLRAVIKGDKAKLLPGEQVSYRISLVNIGTAPARKVALRVGYPPQYEPISLEGFRQEAKGALVLDGLMLKPEENRDYNVTFQLKGEALAEQEFFLRADVSDLDLDKKESFLSATSVAQRVSSVTATTMVGELVAIPGQVLAAPIVVTNTGNIRESFAIRATGPEGAAYTFSDDANRDGKRQGGEPIVTMVGPLSPKQEAHLVMEVATPVSAKDASVASASISFLPESAGGKSASVKLQLAYSRPIVELSMAARGGKIKPGEVSSLELNCVNRGSNLAKQVTLQSILPAQLEMVAAEPAFSKADNGVYLWRFDELRAGEKRTIKVTYRVKPGLAVGTSMQLKNLVNYQDTLGNRY